MAANYSPEQLAALAKEDQGPLTISLIIAFTVIAFVCVLLRGVSRIKLLGRALGWEDYTIILSMGLSVAAGVFQVFQSQNGIGKHAVFVRFPEDVVTIFKQRYISIILYNLSLCLTKISILLQYKRIFTVAKMHIPIYIVMGICVAYGVSVFFTSVFSCVPIRAYWEILEQPYAKCIPNVILWWVNGSLNIACDFLVAILPIRAIWHLQIPMRQKLALLAILTIGWFVCVVSILRFNTLVVINRHPEDATYYAAPISYWSSIEMNLSIVCASLPALKPLFVKIVPAFGSRKGSRSRSYGLNSSRQGGDKSLRGTGGRSQDPKGMDLEMGRTANARAYPADPSHEAFGRNIYVSRQIKQQFEGDGLSSDGESQKDLVPSGSQKSLVERPST